MSDMIADGIAWLGQQLKANASATVSYQQDDTTVSVVATLGASTRAQDDQYDGRIVHSDQDFDFETADLVDEFEAAGLTFTAPKRGDRITKAFAEGSRVYQALPLGNEPCWRWLDSVNHTRLRVHGKYVANA